MHKRLYKHTSENKLELLARGGSTTIELTTPDKSSTVVGTSVCSTEDNFNKRTGNAIALGRALQILENKKKLLTCPSA